MASEFQPGLSLNVVAVTRSEVERFIEKITGYTINRMHLKDGIHLDEEMSLEQEQVIRYTFDVVVEVVRNEDKNKDDDANVERFKLLEGSFKVAAVFTCSQDRLLDENSEVRFQARQLIYSSLREHVNSCIRHAGLGIEIPFEARQPDRKRKTKSKVADDSNDD